MNGALARKLRKETSKATVEAACLGLDGALTTMASQPWRVRLQFALAILRGNVKKLRTLAYGETDGDRDPQRLEPSSSPAKPLGLPPRR